MLNNQYIEQLGLLDNAWQDVQHFLDAKGLSCPMPLLKTKLLMKQMQAGETLCVLASDGGSWRDIPAYLNQVEYELIKAEQYDNTYAFLIKK